MLIDTCTGIWDIKGPKRLNDGESSGKEHGISKGTWIRYWLLGCIMCKSLKSYQHKVLVSLGLIEVSILYHEFRCFFGPL